jgi:hypothetical protein
MATKFSLSKTIKLVSFFNNQRNGGIAKVSELANVLGVPAAYIPYIASKIKGLYRTTWENEPAYTNDIKSV